MTLRHSYNGRQRRKITSELWNGFFISSNFEGQSAVFNICEKLYMN